MEGSYLTNVYTLDCIQISGLANFGFEIVFKENVYKFVHAGVYPLKLGAAWL
ncbi:hypothetical protein DFO55_12485 [Grimontella sp. AG753]|nr:hypothetical protein DFO55_12485 [Grimontella sp. AG753]